MKKYKDYRKETCNMPTWPEVRQVVDVVNGVVYINKSAKPDAKMIMLLTNA